MNRKDPTLLRTQDDIDGAWCDADVSTTFNVTNPVDGSVVAQVADMGAGETTRAIEAANAAWPASMAVTAIAG